MNCCYRALENLIIWTVVREKVNFLPRKYKESKLEFDKVYRGTNAISSRSISCANMVLDNMEFAVGRLYVAKYFKSTSKKAVSCHQALAFPTESLICRFTKRRRK